jgi:copper resistance protein B
VKPALLALGFAFSGGAAANAMEQQTFHMVRGEIDASQSDDADVLTWDGESWIGGDINRLWFKTEGNSEDGDIANAEIQALWSRNIADFWDLQAGVRVDLEPDTTTYLALGVQGLAPYRFETEATAFLSEDGDLSARLHQSFDLHLTQRLIAEPYFEINAYAQDLPERDIGAGFSDAELGLQLRYEITRKFAPYVDVVWESALGETASIARANGEDVRTESVRAGIRVWF